MNAPTRLSVNRPAFLSALAFGMMQVVQPPQGAALIDWFPFTCFTMVALTGALSALIGMRNRYLFRLSLVSATRSSRLLGDARFASLTELNQAGMLDPTSGILLCTVHGVPVFLPRGFHFFLEGPSGSGKSSCSVVAQIFHLVHLGYSVAVSDLKPELCFIVAPELERRGFRVRFNNPARIAGLPHHDANPLAAIIRAVNDSAIQGTAFPLAESFALEITPETKESSSDNRYFRNLERQLFVALVVGKAAVDPEGCIPSIIHRHTADPDATVGLLLEIAESEALEGDIAAEAKGLLSLNDRHPEHFEGARTGLQNALSGFRSSSDLGLLGATNDFDQTELRDESKAPTVVFDLVPKESVEVYVKALALQTIARMHVLKTVPGRCVAFCQDEATNLPVKATTQNITLMRSSGAFLSMMVQSRSEAETVFGQKSVQTIIGNSVEQYLRVGDATLAEYISKRVGDHTVVTTGRSFSMDDGKASTSTSETARPLLPVDEVLSMPSDATLVFVPGMRPILGRKVAYFETVPFKHWAETNPQERHAPSERTDLALAYGDTAMSDVVPSVVNGARLVRAALRRQQRSSKMPRVALFDLRSLYWVPIAASVFAFISIIGTPHVLFEYERVRFEQQSVSCTYVGVTGFRSSSARGSCPWFLFFTEGEKPDGRRRLSS